MNEGQHISSAFDRDLEAIQALIMKMGGLVEDSILKSVKALKNSDEELASEVVKGDRAVDELQDLITEEATRVIALRAPTAIDLRIILTVFRISTNLERIGDYSKNLAKRTKVLSQLPPVDDAPATLLEMMGREVRMMLKDALDAYIRRDVELATDVLMRDESVDQMYNSIFRELITFMLEDPRNISVCMHLHFAAKNTERIGDHVTSIAEQVIYMVTGEKPETARPKDDMTSIDPNASILKKG